MTKTQEVLNEYKSLKKSYSELADAFNKIASMQAIYNPESGNLTIENVQITIE